MDDPIADEVPTGDVRFRCPGCDEEVDVSADGVGRLVRCPYCNAAFFAAQGETHAEVVDDTEQESAADDARREDELDGLRIRKLATLRRATLRTRSWWVIGAVMATAASLDLAYKAARFVAHYRGWGLRPTLFAAFAVGAAGIAVAAAREAVKLGRELATPALPPPAQPPDFSTLGDGSDRWRLLERVR